jgi:threonine synthase
MVQYISTRGNDTLKSFEEVLLEGLAPDGGLYLPDAWPQIDFKSLKGKSYNDIAEEVMFPFVEGAIDRVVLRELIDETYSPEYFGEDIAPLKEIAPGLHVLELFHGPTLAFKDFALQFLGHLFDHVLQKKNQKITIVGATSGDTGSAAIEGCRLSDRVEIFILHPHGRVSDVQRRQMTTVDAHNVHNIAVEGTFDDCQAHVKSMFSDEIFRRKMNLSAVNSINFARIMAQIVYYFYAASKIENANFVVPTGNFGNVFAAYAAKKMGAPIGNLCIATNRNDILTRFFETGEMKSQDVTPTISPSMDIQISSNFERYLFDLLEGDAKKLSALMDGFKKTGSFKINSSLLQKAQQDFTAQRCSENETLETMKKIHAGSGYVLDPHSAIGVHAALKADKPVITLATAHPAKFPDAVFKATGVYPPLPPRLQGLMEKTENFEVLPNNLQKIKDFIARRA